MHFLLQFTADEVLDEVLEKGYDPLPFHYITSITSTEFTKSPCRCTNYLRSSQVLNILYMLKHTT